MGDPYLKTAARAVKRAILSLSPRLPLNNKLFTMEREQWEFQEQGHPFRFKPL